jgi:hypothetical protein
LKSRRGAQKWLPQGSYPTCSVSIYTNKDAIVIAGKTRPTSGTRIDGRISESINKKKIKLKNINGKFSQCELTETY